MFSHPSVFDERKDLAQQPSSLWMPLMGQPLQLLMLSSSLELLNREL
jgi:hypothetical protein